MSITRRSPKAPRKPNRHDQRRNFFLGASRTQHAHDPTAVQNVGAKAIRLRKLETVGKFHERKRLESINERHGEGLKTARTSSVVAHGDLSSEFVHRTNQLRVTRNKCRSLCLLNRHMADRVGSIIHFSASNCATRPHPIWITSCAIQLQDRVIKIPNRFRCENRWKCYLEVARKNGNCKVFVLSLTTRVVQLTFIAHHHLLSLLSFHNLPIAFQTIEFCEARRHHHRLLLVLKRIPR